MDSPTARPFQGEGVVEVWCLEWIFVGLGRDNGAEPASFSLADAAIENYDADSVQLTVDGVPDGGDALEGSAHESQGVGEGFAEISESSTCGHGLDGYTSLMGAQFQHGDNKDGGSEPEINPWGHG